MFITSMRVNLYINVLTKVSRVQGFIELLAPGG